MELDRWAFLGLQRGGGGLPMPKKTIHLGGYFNKRSLA